MVDLSKSYLPEFFARPTVKVARDLIGAVLCMQHSDNKVQSAQIVEVEAYTKDDPACHAFRGRTKRTEVMFGPPGHAYVYFIYGMYFCLNVVTEPEGTPGAVLVRAVDFAGCDGPGKLCRRWGITGEHNGMNLLQPDSQLWLSPGPQIRSTQIGVGRRIGISQATERRWRFFLKDNPMVSRQKASR